MPIIDDDILAEALSKFDLAKLVNDISDKKEIIRNWVTALDNGDIKSEGEDQNKPQFFQQIFSNVLDYSQEKSYEVKNLILEEKTPYDTTKPDAILGFFRIEKGKRKKRTCGCRSRSEKFEF